MYTYVVNIDSKNYYIDVLESRIDIITPDSFLLNKSPVFKTKYSIVILVAGEFVVIDLYNKKVEAIKDEYIKAHYVANDIYRKAIVKVYMEENNISSN